MVRPVFKAPPRRKTGEQMKMSAKSRLASMGFIARCKSSDCPNTSENHRLVNGYCGDCLTEIQGKQNNVDAVVNELEAMEMYDDEGGSWS